jgi:hypothetical protein
MLRSPLNVPSRSLIALAGLVAVGIGGWLLWPSTELRIAPHVESPDDDLEMLAALLDAAGPRIPDLLVAGPAALYVAHGADGTIEAHVKTGEPRLVARIGAPVQGMTLVGDTLLLTTGRSMQRLAVTGGSPAIVTDRLTRPHAIASDGRWVFVVDVDAGSTGLLRASTVVRVPVAGGDPVVLGRYQGEVTNVALGGDSAYWADRLEGTIVSVPKSGGEPRALASDRGLPGQVVVAGDTVAWVEKRSESLWAMPRTGGTPRQLAQDFAGFARVVVRGGAIVWVGESPVDAEFHLLSVPVAGGEVSAAGPAAGSIDALASDGTKLFWLREGIAGEVPAGE